MATKRQQLGCEIAACFLVLVFDIAAGILGIQAEVAQSKVGPQLKVWIFECRYPSHEAFKLGLAAATLLLVAHALSNLLPGCAFCIRSKEEDELHVSSSSNNARRRLAFVSLVIQWLVLALAFSILIMGTLGNSRSRKACGISRQHYLSAGGILCFVHALFSLSYYYTAAAAAAAPEEETAEEGKKKIKNKAAHQQVVGHV